MMLPETVASLRHKLSCAAVLLFLNAVFGLVPAISAHRNETFFSAAKHENPFVTAVNGEALILEEGAGAVKKIRLKTSRPVFKAFGLTSDLRKLLYVSLKNNRPSGELFLEDLKTGARKKITPHLVIAAAVSPANDNLVAYSFSGGNSFGLALAEIESGRIEILATENVFPEILEWSETGAGVHFYKTLFQNEAPSRMAAYVAVDSPLLGDPFFAEPPAGFPVGRSSDLTDGILRTFRQGNSQESPFSVGAPDGVHTISGGDLFGKSRLSAVSALTGKTLELGDGRFIKALQNGVVFREFGASGTKQIYVDWQGSRTDLGATVVDYNLPEKSSTLIQGGESYNPPGNCNIGSHLGIMEFAYDFKSPVAGEHILSAADGLVVFNSSDPDCPNCAGTFFGETVIIQHADGTYSKYAHLETGSPQVTVGTDVCQGLYIARQGNTGSTNGNPHLHFQRQSSPDIFGQAIALNFSDTPANPLSCGVNYASASNEIAHSISANAQHFGISGGPGSVNVTSTGCSWSATSRDSWITITSPGVGSGNGVVNFSVADNSASGARTGTMNIGGHLFTVTQDGGGVTNQPPTVNAGTDQTITLPASAVLNGAATDDGLPNPPAAVTTVWSKLSGPGSVTFGDPNALNTTAVFSMAGIYVLRLTANDGALVSADDLRVIVNTTNGGGSLSGSPSAHPAAVNLTAEGTLDWTHWGLNSGSDFNHKNGVAQQIGNFTQIGSIPPLRFSDSVNSYSWNDGTPTANTSNTKTGIFLYQPGNGFMLTIPADTTAKTLKLYLGLYTSDGLLEATMSDGSASPYVSSQTSLNGSKSVLYTINFQAASNGQNLIIKWTIPGSGNSSGNISLRAAALKVSTTNQPPAVNAGTDQAIALPSTANLAGSATDDGLPNPPAALTTAWSKLSGPGTVAFANPNALATTAAFSTAGIYTLRLTANDGALTSTDDVQITVNNGGPSTGYLTYGGANTPAGVNLTAEGAADWAHWGLNSANGFNRKNNVPQKIGNYTKIGSGTVKTFNDGVINYSWNDGTPTASVTNNTSGLYLSGVNKGFEITVPADTADRTLKLYVGLYAARGKLQAFLSDASAPTIIDTSIQNQTNSSNTVYTINYKAGAANQNLKIRWTVETMFNAFGNVTLQAAALTESNVPVVNQPPTVNAGTDQTVTLPSTANLAGSATDDGLPNPPAALTTAWSKLSGPGTVAFANPNALATTAAFSTAGIYTLRLTANDGALVSTDDIQITVNGAGGTNGTLIAGSNSASVNNDLTAEGAVDWAHWGLNGAAGFNHKSGVAQQISNFTKIGTGSVQSFADNSILYSWNDGTPVASVSNRGSAIYLAGLNRGFEINIPADQTLKTLRLYVGLFAAQGKLEAILSDASAPPIVDTSVVSQNGSANQVFTINFRAASSGQNLKIRWTSAAVFSQYANVTLQAAALSLANGAPVNQPPSVNAGADQNITLPSSANLSGTASDDGLPNPPALLVTTWSKISGPGTVSFGNADALNTAASFSAAGTYVIRLTADDGGLTSNDDVTVNVLNQTPTNSPPTVNAGSDQTITFPSGSILNGAATDDGLPNPPGALTTAWSKVSGPGTVAFGAAGSLNTTADFSAAGTYVLRLTADDSALSAADDIQITVNGATGSTGSLTVGNSASPGIVNLTAEGAVDWAHWGLNGAGKFNHKSGVAQQISNFTKIGTGSVQSFTDNSILYQWNDGIPVVSSNGNGGGIYILGLNRGFEINVPADQTLKTLRLYVGLFAAQGKLEAILSDASAPPIVDTSVVSQNGSANQVFTINFQAASSGQNLKIRWTSAAVFSQYANLTLQAATLTDAAGGTPPPPASEFQISSSAPFAQFGTHIAKNDSGDFVVAWQSNGQDGSGWGIFARKYNAAGIPLTNEFQVNTYTLDNQFVPGVSMDAAGNFVVVWESKNQDGNGYGIFARRYDSTGIPLGGEFQVNTYTAQNQHDPAMAMSPSGNFVVVWSSDFQDGSQEGIYGQRFDSSGARQGGEFQVNTTTLDAQRQSRVTIDASGNFVVGWESLNQDGSGYGVYGQRFDAAGLPQGGEFRVNTVTANDQFALWMAMSPTGDFVFTWCSTGQDGSGSGVFAQRFDAAGIRQGAEFKVNTFTASNQIYPTIALDANNDFIVVWESLNQDGSGRGVYGQRYNAAGIPQGGEFQINTYAVGDQSNPHVAKDSAGNFTVIWTSSGQDGSGGGVFGKRFDAAGNPLNVP